MLEQEIRDKMKEMDKLINPEEINEIMAWISGFLMDYEEELHPLNLVISNEWLKIRSEVKSNNQADKLLEIGTNYQRAERIKLSMAQLKRMRSDLRSRYEVLTMKNHY